MASDTELHEAMRHRGWTYADVWVEYRRCGGLSRYSCSHSHRLPAIHDGGTLSHVPAPEEAQRARKRRASLHGQQGWRDDCLVHTVSLSKAKRAVRRPA
jgi:hypothetical protein